LKNTKTAQQVSSTPGQSTALAFSSLSNLLHFFSKRNTYISLAKIS